MKVLKNSLEAVWDRWEDPGDYPSNAGAGPLPPGPWQLTGVDGSLVIELTPKEMIACLHQGFAEAMGDEITLPNGVAMVAWHIDGLTVTGEEDENRRFQLVLSCEECEADTDYCGAEPPDHEDY